jgi:cold shock CspA family protein
MSLTTNDVTISSETELFTGRVKWFNNKAGYGFITVTNSSRSGSDIFVHHTAINVDQEQYKYLVQGEYVEFNLVKTTSGVHEFQASNVDGIQGGKLMCETRNDNKLNRTNYSKSKNEVVDEVLLDITPKQEENVTKRAYKPRVREEGPRCDVDSKNLVKDKKPRAKKQPTTKQSVDAVSV